MQTYLTKSEINTLANLKKDTLLSITAEDWQNHDISYGNILLESAHHTVEINNDYRLVPFLGDTEELVGFKINQLKDISDFEPSVPKDALRTKKINESVENIILIRDTISINYSNGTNEHHLIDQAIIFKLESTDWLISLLGLYMPIEKMIFKRDVLKDIRSVDDVISDWEDTDYEERGLSHPRYQVHVGREIIEI